MRVTHLFSSAHTLGKRPFVYDQGQKYHNPPAPAQERIKIVVYAALWIITQTLLGGNNRRRRLEAASSQPAASLKVKQAKCSRVRAAPEHILRLWALAQTPATAKMHYAVAQGAIIAFAHPRPRRAMPGARLAAVALLVVLCWSHFYSPFNDRACLRRSPTRTKAATSTVFLVT